MHESVGTKCGVVQLKRSKFYFKDFKTLNFKSSYSVHSGIVKVI